MLSYRLLQELYLTATLATAEEVITLSITVFWVAVVCVFSPWLQISAGSQKRELAQAHGHYTYKMKHFP